MEASNPDTGAYDDSGLTDANGCYTLHLDTDKWLITIWKIGFQQKILNVTVASTPLDDSNADTDVTLNAGRLAGEFYRMVMGVQQAGASSTENVRKLFGDLYFDVPGPGSPDSVYGPRLRFWGDVRITSIPEAAPVQLSQIDVGSQASKLNTSQIAESAYFAWGAEWRIFGHPPSTGTVAATAPYTGENNNSYDTGDVQKFTGSLFASFGATTPINPQDSATLVNGALSGAQQLYKDVTGGALTCPTATTSGGVAPACVLALISKDRSRFPEQWYGGLRLKTHYFTPAGIPAKRPPAMLDLGIGQNALVTRGELRGWVLKMEAFYPLPFQQLRMVYLFGRADIHISGKDAFTNPYVLVPDTTGATVASSNVQTLVLPNPNRDTYHFGIGVDLLSLVAKLVAKTPAK